MAFTRGPSMMRIRSAVGLIAIATAWLVLAPADAIAQKRQRDRISREEILKSPHRNLDLYQVIRALRPHFLERPAEVRTLGGSRPLAPLAVYVDGVRDMGPETLRTIAAPQVEDVRYLDPTRSENEFGSRANGGAVLVKLYRRPQDLRPARDSTPPR